MYKFEKTRREVQHQRFNQNDAKYPSFSSTLLDQIYRSIDEGEEDTDMKKKKNNNFYTAETTTKKQITRINAKFHRTVEEEEANLRRTWKSSEKVKNQMERRSQLEQDQDVQFFSSTSSSSDSSSGLLSSSSDTESVYGGVKSRASCFAPSKPKPVKTSVAAERRRIASEEDGLIKSKSRAVKIYDNLKKVKQPISPGGKLTSFLNSLFTNTKKTKTGEEDVNAERKVKSGQASGSTCSSSASSFSRSCLSKKSSSSSSKDIKRTVRFYPVSVILDEDSRPCGHKCLYEKKEEEIGRLAVKKKEEEEVIMEKSRRVEEAAREFLREYRRNHQKILTEEDIEDDDVSSCCSSDLFELDHLSVMGGGDRKKYCEELPVYETTNFTTNRAIAKGLIM